jgi:anti-anti-sigma regulatory factor
MAMASGAVTLRLNGTVRLTEAAELAAQLTAILPQRDIVVETSDLQDLDGSLVQVLVAARRDAVLHGNRLTVITSPQTPFHTLVHKLHLAAALGCETAPQDVGHMTEHSI